MQLNSEQKKALENGISSLLIVAGAGTGKTRVLVEKIIKIIEDKNNNILALTFTNKAADEMNDRIKKKLNINNLPFIGTFHSYGVFFLREFGKHLNIESNFIIFDRNDTKQLVGKIMKELNIKDISRGVMQNAISLIKNEREVDTTIINYAQKVLPIYERELKKLNALDFDDLIEKTIKILAREKEVRKTIQERYQYIFIDEFQDIDEKQNEIIKFIFNKNTKVIAVGDTDQTIYSWRGASIFSMINFTKIYAPADIVFLVKNYRSPQKIIDFANRIIDKNKMRQKKQLICTKDKGEDIEFMQCFDENEESYYIASEIKKLLQKKVKPESIAVLFRANFQGRAIENQMVLNEIPYSMLGARFFDRAEIKGLIYYLRLIQNENDIDSLIKSISIPRRGVGENSITKYLNNVEMSVRIREKIELFLNEISVYKKYLEKNNLAETIKFIMEKLNYNEYIIKNFENPKERIQETLELISFANNFSHLSGEEALHQFLSQVSLGSDQDTLRHNRGGVRLMTVHSSKGLEFDYVFITGMEEGVFPMRVDEDTDEEEERRLCYVAITRTKEKLWCTYAKRRGIFGTYRDMKPSSFLEGELEEELKKEKSRKNNSKKDFTDYEEDENIEW